MEGPGPQRNVVLRYRGREIDSAAIADVAAAIARFGEAGRAEIARQLCTQWDWRQPNGSIKEFACRDLLLRLHRRGLITLSPARGVSPGRRPRARSLLDYPLPVYPWPLQSADLDTLVVRPIGREEVLGWRILVDRFHYLGDVPPMGESVLYAAYLEGQVVACLAWGSAARHCAARDQFIGWDSPTRAQRLPLVVNNTRFLLLPWIRVPHLASKILATNLRRLDADWQRSWGHCVVLAETFVDRARFAGTCYRASNWRHVGESAGRARRGHDYRTHGRPKAIYVYPLHRRWQRMLTSGDGAT